MADGEFPFGPIWLKADVGQSHTLTIAWLTAGDEDHDAFLFPVGTLARVTDPSGAVADIPGVLAGNRVSFTFTNLVLGAYEFQIIGGPSAFLFATGHIDVTKLNPQFPTPPWREVGVRGPAWYPGWWDNLAAGPTGPLPTVEEVAIGDVAPIDPLTELWVDMTSTVPPGGTAVSITGGDGITVTQTGSSDYFIGTDVGEGITVTANGLAANVDGTSIIVNAADQLEATGSAAPAVVIPGVPEADFSTTGTVDFIAGSAAVTVSIDGLTYTGAAALPDSAWTRVAPLPAGVAAPLVPIVWLTGYGTPAGGFDNQLRVLVDANGVQVRSFVSRTMATGKMFSASQTWAI